MVSLFLKRILPLVSVVGVLLCAVPDLRAQDEGIVFGGGLSVDSDARVYLDAKLKLALREGGDALIGALDARVPVQNEEGRLGDAAFHVDIEYSAAITDETTITSDLSYDFEREVSAATAVALAHIETQHDVGSSVGLLWRSDYLLVNADVSGSVSIFDDFEVIGLGDFDRGFRDYVDYEAAVRLAFLNQSKIFPFIEFAYVGRKYIDSARPNFVGPELIAGIEVEGVEFSGQLAAIVAYREQDGGEDHLLLGPYIDVTWRPSDASEVIFAVGSSFAQESIGSQDVYEVLSGSIVFNDNVTDALRAEFKLDAALENDPGPGKTFTLDPSLRFVRALAYGLEVSATLSATVEKERGDPFDLDFAVSFGFFRLF